MGTSQKKLNLLDLVDVNTLQSIQDAFAKAMNVASLMVDDNGNITKPSNFINYCKNYIRKNEEGLRRCQESDILGGKIAAQKNKPYIYKCHSGLTHFAVPIIVSGQHIASILGGQFCTEKLKREHFEKIGNILGINSEDFIKSSEEIKLIPQENLEAAAQLLFIVANNISSIAHKNLLLKEKSKEDEFLKEIIQIIRGTLDTNQVKQQFIANVRNYFDADRCLFVDYDKNLNKFLPMKFEKLKSQTVKSLKNIDTEKEFPEFCNKLKKGHNVIIRDLDKTLSRKKLLSYQAINSLINSDVKSDYGLLVKYQEQIIGILIIHFVTKKRILSRDEFKFLKTISDHAATGIYQAQLYEKLREITAHQNGILNNIPFMAWLKDINGVIFTVNKAYLELINKPLEEIVGKTDLDLYPESHAQNYLSEDKLVMQYKQTLNIEELIVTNKGERWYETFKSPVIDDNGKILGTAGLARDITERREQEIELLKRQELILKANKRETLLRNIFETIRSTLNIDEIKNTIVREVGKAFNADRCFIMDYDQQNKQILSIAYEYLSSSNIPSYIGANVNEEVPNFIEMLKKGQNVIVDDKKIINNENIDAFKHERKIVKKYEVVSAYGIPIFYRNDFFGGLGLHYLSTNYKVKDEDLSLLNIIAGQIAIALYQANLYQNSKLQAERESLLLKITEKIRSSLDIENTLHFISEELAKIFNVQRTAITMYSDPNDYSELIVRKEYILSNEYKGFDSMENFSDIAKLWSSYLTNDNNILAIDNIQEANLPNFCKDSYNKLGVKSIIGTLIKKEEKAWGLLVLSEYSKHRHWSEEEKNLLVTVAGQIYIAINQAELYEYQKITAEREKISRNIIEILRSTLDKNIIKRLFVKNIGKFFNADRVFFSDYDADSYSYLPVEDGSEYLSSNEEMSFIGYDWMEPSIKDYIEPLLEKREFKIYNWDEYIKNNPKNNEFIALFEDANVKSSYNFPVLYQEKIMGYFCIEFTKNVTILSEEDINRIRSICTQAGIAIYHAELYMKAQQNMFSKQKFISEFSQKIKEPISNIIDTSNILLENKNGLEYSIQVEYLNNILDSCNQLIELTQGITEKENL